MPARKPAAGNKSIKQMLAVLSAQRQPPRKPQQLPPSKSQPPLETTPDALAASEQQAEPAEPETTCSDLLASEKRKCLASKKDGTPCRAKPLPSGEYCVFHAPAYAERFQEGREQGARRRETYKLPDQVDDDIWNVDFSLDTRAGVQGSMEAVMRMLVLGRLPTRHASILMRFFDAAIRNLHGVDTLKTIEYVNTLQDFMLISGLIERDLDDQALKERVQQIADTGAKRQEILKANEAFGYLPPDPAQKSSKKSMEAWDPLAQYIPPMDPIGMWGLPSELRGKSWVPRGTGKDGKLTMEDIFPNGLPGFPHHNPPPPGPAP